jgi:hypothetical protein
MTKPIDEKDLRSVAGGGTQVSQITPNDGSTSKKTQNEPGDPNTPDVFTSDAENSGTTDLSNG